MDERTTAERYVEDVLEGRIVACAKLKQLCAMLRPRFADGYKKWHYDADAANRVVGFVERFCCVPSGRRYGKPMLLEPYEKFILEVAFGFVDDEGLRQFNEVLWWVAKKNGKTSLIAAIAHYMMTSDGEGKPEVYVIASAEPQAGLCYGGVDTMRRQSVVNAGICFRLRVEQENKSFATQDFLYQNGISDYLAEQVGDAAFTLPVQWHLETQGRDRADKPEYKFKADISFCFSKTVQLIEYYHNSSYLEYGGSPDKAVRSAFTYAIDKFCKARDLYKKNESKIGFQDVEDCLALVINSFSTLTS